MKQLNPLAARAIVFDAVGTLIHPAPAAPLVYAEVGRRFGSRRTGADIQQRFTTAFQQEEFRDRVNGWLTSETREFERWQQIVARVLDDVEDPAACFSELYEHFARPSAWRCEAEAAETLRELAERGYILGMASNYDHRLRSVVAGLAGLQSLQHIVISSEVGWRKPASEFYQALCHTIGHSPADILLVGDDPMNDYEGARAAGMQALLLDCRNITQSAAMAQIRQLKDLLIQVRT